MKLFYTEKEMRTENMSRYLNQPYFREVIYPIFPITFPLITSSPSEITDSIITYKRVIVRNKNQETFLYILEDQIEYVLNLLNIEKH